MMVSKGVIKLLVKPQHVEVESPYYEVTKLIDGLLAYITPNARYIRSKKLSEAKERARGNAYIERIAQDPDVQYWQNWDGKIHPFKNDKFPIGYLWRVQSLLRVKNYNVEVTDLRNLPYKLPLELRPQFTGKLRDYQQEALAEILKHSMGVIEMGTGAGKTVIALALLQERPVHTTIIVPSVELVDDWLYRTKENITFPDKGKYIGFAQSKQHDLALINIINIDTLYSALFRASKQESTAKRHKAIQDAYINSDMIIVDECHRSASAKYKRTIKESIAYYRYGFTATADKRGDQADTEYYGLLGDKLVKVTSSELIKQGHLVKTIVIFKCWGRLYIPKGTPWSGAGGIEDLGIVYNASRNDVIARDSFEAWMGQSRQTMVLFNRLDHGSMIKDLIDEMVATNPATQIKPCIVEWLHGTHPRRKEIVRDYRAGKINILITQYQILGEGVDIPPVACIVIALGGKAQIRLIQGLGRGLRKSEGKTDVIIFDYADEGNYIQEHAESRLKTYHQEPEFDIRAKDTILEAYNRHLSLVG